MDAQKLRIANAILEGLEYPSVTREHTHLKASKRVDYVKADSAAASKMIDMLAQQEGIIPAIETAGAIAWAAEAAQGMSRDSMVVVMVSQRIDKDIYDVARLKGTRI